MSTAPHELEPNDQHTAYYPKFMGDETAAAAHWRLSVEAEGYAPAGEPEVADATLDGGELALWGGHQPYKVTGKVKKPEPVTVNEVAVTAAARTLARRGVGNAPWEAMPAEVRNFYMRVAVDALNAAAPHLSVRPSG